MQNDNIKVADLGSCKSIQSTYPYTHYVKERMN